MKDWSRRNLLRAGAGAAVGAAVAVPMTALTGTAVAVEPVAAEPAAAANVAGFSDAPGGADIGPVMFCVHDAQRGEVSILHGTNEVIVTDRQLVNRILQAAGPRLS